MSATGRQVLALSWSALRKDRDLIALPLLGAIGTIMVSASLIIPAAIMGAFHTTQTATGTHVRPTPLATIVGVLVGMAVTGVGMFLQVALVSGALERLDGGDPTLRSALGAAWRRRRAIASWVLLACTVGTILRAVQQRLGFLGRLLNLAGGVAFGVGSYFVAPVIAAEGLGAWPAFKRSSGLLYQRWGKVVRTELRFGVLLALATVAGMAIGGAVIAAAFVVSTILGIVAVVAFVCALITGILVVNAVQGYARAVLYRYAVDGLVEGFPDAAFTGVMKTKR